MQATMDNRSVLSRAWKVPDGVPGVPSPAKSTAGPKRAGENKALSFDDGLAKFMSLRPRLFGIAHRMLGSTAEAEDIVQDAWVRWQTTDRSQVRDAAAFLVTTATRLAINVIQSARWRRETDVGPRMPEPVDTAADAGSGAERTEALESGVFLLLEKLSPTERAAYVLREAFDYTYHDIANVLRLEEANARQVTTRARQHVASGRRRPANSTTQRRLVACFIAAARRGDVSGLEGFLASDVPSTSARGGCHALAHHPERDRDHGTRHRGRHRPHRVNVRDQAGGTWA